MKRTKLFHQLVVIITTVALVAGFSHLIPPEFKNVPKAQAAAQMMLFFDGDPIPAGWTSLSASASDIFYQKFPRGNSTYGSSGGADTHTHTATVSNVSGPDINFSSATTGTAFAESTHYHGFDAVTDAQSLMPSRRELQVMQYDAGIPSGASAIPDGAIAIFDTTSMPANWTRYSAQDNYFVRGGPDGEITGGGDICQHATTITQNTLFVPGIGNTGAFPPAQALTNHEHTVGIQITAGGDHTPVNIDIVLGKISGAGSIPGDMLAMFTAAPGGGWVSKSASSEDFYQKYFEAKSAYAASGGGAATHNHDSAIGITTDPNDTSGNGDRGTGDLASLDGHTHTLDLAYTAADNLPAYVDVLVYKYSLYTPKSTDWRWYDAEQTADPANSNGSDTSAGDALDSENTMPTSTRIVYNANIIKLRIGVNETTGGAGTDVKFHLEYDTLPLFLAATNVGEIGSGIIWRYADGVDSDNGAISSRRISTTTASGTHNESGTSASTFDPAASTSTEFEFTIQNNGAIADTRYYFRLYYTENSGGAGTPNGAVALTIGNSYPNVTTAAAYDLELSTAPASVSYGSINAGDNDASYIFTADEKIGFWDKRSTGTYTLSVSGTNMTNGGNTILNSDITWKSPGPDDAGDILNVAFTSSKTGMVGQNGATLAVPRSAYVADPASEGKGGFYFSPTIDLTSLWNKPAGNYVGTVTLTIV